jgi:NitT/TauT family transport system permease protein
MWELTSNPPAALGWEGRWSDIMPPPSAVITTWLQLLMEPSYWESWWLSLARVFSGFSAAVIIGVPLGLAMAMSRVTYGVVFPTFEVFRPIPPLAWVPASIIFWPTQWLSISFVTFLGAFTTIVINVIGGVRSVDTRYINAAKSMGASDWNVFRRIVLPGTLPSIAVGAEVGMGITWAVVVAAEMISGGGSTVGGAGGGLGYFIWNSYVGGKFPEIVVGMISIGIAGFVASALIRKLGEISTPWLRTR